MQVQEFVKNKNFLLANLRRTMNQIKDTDPKNYERLEMLIEDIEIKSNLYELQRS